jgi:hypothetical protein
MSWGNLIKVVVDLAEPMREGDMIRCLVWAKGAGGFTMWFKRVQGSFEVIPTQFWIRRYKALVGTTETSNSNEVIKDTLGGLLDTYTLAQDLNALVCWCLWYGAIIMHMVWCKENVVMQCHQLLVNWGRMHYTGKWQWKGSLNGKSTWFQMREIKIEFRKDKPTSA